MVSSSGVDLIALSTGLSLVISKFSRSNRSNSEIPDESILKLEEEAVCWVWCWCIGILDIVETKRSFPVSGNTPKCSKVRV